MRNNTFGSKASEFFLNLKTPGQIPSPFGILNPYKNEEVKQVLQKFYSKYYSDNSKRVFIFGINPGRYGGGISGISFTDPVALENYCGIENSFQKKRELSSTFIYSLIGVMGGPSVFFSRYFLTALFPLALIREEKNVNYYDNPVLYSSLKYYICKSVKCQSDFGAYLTAVSLGKKNALYLEQINKELHLFEKILVLEHPRFIMQYRRKKLAEYLAGYSELLWNI